MKKQTEVFESWLPIFSGFYNTIWEISEDFEYQLKEDVSQDYVIELLEKNNIPLENWENVIEHCWNNIDYGQREIDVVKQICDLVESELKELKMIDSLQYENITYPKEYNFRNNSGNIKILLTAENISNIKEYLSKHSEEFKKHIEDSYSSCSGFISFHSSNYLDWVNSGNEEYFLNGNHKLGAVLSFILNNQYDDNDTLEVSMYYNVEVYATEYLNYEGMIEDYKKEGAK